MSTEELQTTAPDDTAKSVNELNKLTKSMPAFLKKAVKDIPDCSTDDGLKQAKEDKAVFAERRLAIVNHHKDAKAFYWDNGKLVDSMKNELLDSIEPHETKLKVVIAEAMAETKRIEQEAIDKENRRIESTEALMADIAAMAGSSTLDEVKDSIDKIDNLNLQDFQEFADAAESKAEAMLATLTQRKAELEKQRDEQIALEAQREEQERQAAELKKQQDELDAKQREMEKQQAVQDARIAAEAKAQQERAEASEREKQAAIQAEKDKAAAVEQARIDEAKLIEAKRVAAEETAAADKAERERIAALAPNAEKLRSWFLSIEELPTLENADDETKRVHQLILDALNDIDNVTTSLNRKVEEAA